MIYNNILETVGRTPIVRINRLAPKHATVYVKVESFNPGGSVKDRAALGIIRAAEQHGQLAAGGTVVEGTAGNTGIAIAHLCHARGYRVIIVMPDNQSAEKYQALEALGVDLRRVKAVPYADPNHYQRVAGRVAQETPAACVRGSDGYRRHSRRDRPLPQGARVRRPDRARRSAGQRAVQLGDAG